MKLHVKPAELLGTAAGITHDTNEQAVAMLFRLTECGNEVNIQITRPDAKELQSALTQLVGDNQPPVGKHTYEVAMTPRSN